VDETSLLRYEVLPINAETIPKSMSDLHRQLARPPPRPAQLKGPPPLFEEDEDSSSSASSLDSIVTIVAPNEGQRGSIPTSTWKDYFEQELYLDCPEREADYHVYLTQPANPSKDPLFVCHHGAGSSGLSFACFAKEVRRRLPRAGVLSIDAREHGSVVARHGDDVDFSLDALSQDLLAMVNLTQAKLWLEMPNLVLLGHSLGGAVVTRLARDGIFGSKLVGFGVIDVVEGSAIEALQSMKTYLANRPSSFPTLESAVEWHVRSRTVRNRESATVSTPGLLVESRPGSWTWRTDLTSMYFESSSSGLLLLITYQRLNPRGRIGSQG